MPLASQIENAMNIAFFDDEERRQYYVKFELKGLLRGDVAARTAFYTAMLDRGVMNADEVRELEDMNPQADGLGQTIYVPLNWVPKGQSVNMQITSRSDEPHVESREEISKTAEIRSARAVRTAAIRRKLTVAYKPKLETIASDLVSEELSALREAVGKISAENGIAEFQAFIEEFYPEFKKRFAAKAGSFFSAYGNDILPVALEEASSTMDVAAQFERFRDSYTDTLATRHVGSSRGQIKELINEHRADPEALAKALNQRLDEWQEKRAGKIVMQESVRSENAFAHAIFKEAGVGKVVSVAYGDNCPYCDSLNGTVVGIDEAFLQNGEYQPDGADAPLIVASKKSHPPYHPGCDCGITVSY